VIPHTFKNSKFAIVVGSLVALVLALTMACSSSRTNVGNPSAIGKEVIDDAGRRIILPERVDRVVSLAPNLTEIVFAVGAGSSLVGDTSYCDFPAEAKSIEKVGDTLHPSLERIISLKPQLVLVSTASQLEGFTEQLKSHNISVFVTDPHDLEGVFRSITQIGDILGRSQAAA